MPKSLMQECYKLLGADSYQSMRICLFRHICCVLHMGMSSTCILIYSMPSLQGCMPCIFVIFVVTSTSMQSRPRNISIYRDLVISLSLSAVILLPCKLDARERFMHILEMYSKDVL